MAGRRRRHLACMVVAAAAFPLAQCREGGHTVTIRPLTKPREPARVPYRPQRTAPATSWLVNANIAAFVLLLGRGRLFSKLAMDDALVLRGQWHRAVTACALHGGALHLYCNMMALRAIGPATERAFGSARFCGTYAASGLAGNLLFLNPARPPSIGASGARALYESIARGRRTPPPSRRHLGVILARSPGSSQVRSSASSARTWSFSCATVATSATRAARSERWRRCAGTVCAGFAREVGAVGVRVGRM